MDEALLVPRHLRVCEAKGAPIPAGGRVLDFGCGGGELVYAYRDAGYNAEGFDIHDTLRLRAPEDRCHFTTLGAESRDTANYSVDWERFRLPYPDATFDLVCSTETFEHVLDHAAVLREIARVLKATGASLHTFPPKFTPIEEHIFVPGGTLFRSRAYFLPWALLGIRNEYQRGMGPLEVARANARYVRTGLNYISPRRLRKLATRWFEVSEFVPALWEKGGPWEPRNALSRMRYTNMIKAVWYLARPLR
jgi:SAM-dependent methyltransferase